jgi:hypothetical protein
LFSYGKFRPRQVARAVADVASASSAFFMAAMPCSIMGPTVLAAS